MSPTYVFCPFTNLNAMTLSGRLLWRYALKLLTAPIGDRPVNQQTFPGLETVDCSSRNGAVMTEAAPERIRILLRVLIVLLVPVQQLVQKLLRCPRLQQAAPQSILEVGRGPSRVVMEINSYCDCPGRPPQSKKCRGFSTDRVVTYERCTL
jgi:hypothetical protein